MYNLAIHNLLLIQALSSCINCCKSQTRVAGDEAEKRKNVTNSHRCLFSPLLERVLKGFMSLQGEYKTARGTMIQDPIN